MFCADDDAKKRVISFDLLEAINANGLLYFLLANLLTGAVNLSTVTMSASTSLALTLLTVHMLTLSLAVSVLQCAAYARSSGDRQTGISRSFVAVIVSWSDLHARP